MLARALGHPEETFAGVRLFTSDFFTIDFFVGEAA